MTWVDILYYCFAFVGAVALLTALVMFIMAFWFEIRFTIGKEKKSDGKT